ncbi:MAG: hypothetical protein JSR80_07540 [Verrucomicrobia bacterium]|nr:hypothetical protein [Verrucomicrobiota bacterium]
MRWICYFIFVCSPVFAQLGFQESGITLQEFGTQGNTNFTLQLQSQASGGGTQVGRYNPTEPPRTNDFQSLQQIAAQSGETTRVGYFYVSQGQSGVGLTLPSFQSNSTAGIDTPTNNLLITVGCVESNFLRRICTLPTTQTLQMNYSLFSNNPPSPGAFDTALQSLTDYNVIGNPYHDIRFIQLTPLITFTGATVKTLTVSKDLKKLKLGMSTGQTILIYLERSIAPLTFDLSFDRTTLTATGTFTGFLRFAAIQVTALNTSGMLPLGGTFNPQLSAIVAQTRVATPVAMYMLWPNSYLTRVGPQIAANLPSLATRPDCDTLANLLPVLARTDPTRAFFYGNQLNPVNVNTTTNTFITLFNIFVAQNLNADINLYQSTVLTPPVLPPIPSSSVVEATYDTYRSSIPLIADVDFGTQDQVTWTYIMDGTLHDDPLILFPSWKKLLGGGAPSVAYAYLDAIKGPLFAEKATGNSLTFQENPVPTFWATGHFFPTTLTFTPQQRRALQSRFTQDRLLTLVEGDVLATGRQLYMIALTALYGVELMRQTNGNGVAATSDLIAQVKDELQAWLALPHQKADGTFLSDYFVGVFDAVQGLSSDSVLTGGICTTAGLGGTNSSTAAADEFNALYSSHHLQYGYYLGAAAIVIQWDDLFKTPNPFISQEVISATGTIVTMRDLVDMLWRDCRNFAKEDPQLPFNRCGNPWEGHSTENGFLYEVLPQGRFQQNFGEDFLCWMAVNQYAQAILTTPSLDLTTNQKNDYKNLQIYSRNNMEMMAASAKLVFHDATWLYSGPYATNITLGQVYDTQTLATTSFQPGSGACPLLLAAPR